MIWWSVLLIGLIVAEIKNYDSFIEEFIRESEFEAEIIKNELNNLIIQIDEMLENRFDIQNAYEDFTETLRKFEKEILIEKETWEFRESSDLFKLETENILNIVEKYLEAETNNQLNFIKEVVIDLSKTSETLILRNHTYNLDTILKLTECINNNKKIETVQKVIEETGLNINNDLEPEDFIAEFNEKVFFNEKNRINKEISKERYNKQVEAGKKIIKEITDKINTQ